MPSCKLMNLLRGHDLSVDASRFQNKKIYVLFESILRFKLANILRWHTLKPIGVALIVDVSNFILLLLIG